MTGELVEVGAWIIKGLVGLVIGLLSWEAKKAENRMASLEGKVTELHQKHDDDMRRWAEACGDKHGEVATKQDIRDLHAALENINNNILMLARQ